MSNTVFLILRALILTIMTLGMMSTLSDFRFGRRKLLCILAIYSLWVIVSSLALLHCGGELLLLRFFYFTISIPATVLTYWTTNDTPTQAVFNYMTQILLSVLAISIIRLLTESLGLAIRVNILLMCVFYGVIIYLEWRFLRRPFRTLIQMLPAQWGVLTLIPCMFCIYFIFLASWPESYLCNSSQIIYVYAAVIPLVFVYIAVFKSLLAQYRIQMERQSATLLAVQISALKEKLRRVKEVEEDVRIQRHDLRHQLQTVTELVARGDNDAALAFLNAARKRLDEQKVIRWRLPPVLDAVFSSYFDQSKKQGIRISAKISLPSTLPVDEGELAIVLANALENAVHANLELPREQREIRCKMVGTPGIMLEISNPCAGNLVFDSNGLPLSRREGHGLGVQSISAFCRKNEAVCQFSLIDGWFRMRLVL